MAPSTHSKRPRRDAANERDELAPFQLHTLPLARESVTA
jgi:hypothetical protein